MDNGQPKYDINELANKWLKGTITSEEKAYYEKWYGDFDDLETQIKTGPAQSAEEISNRIYQKLNERLKNDEEPKIQRLYIIRRIAAAAVVILCLSIGGYFLLHKKPAPQFAQNKSNDIAPGGNKAVLTLANGQKIVLDSAHNGTIALQGATQIQKTSNGQLVYTAGNKSTSTQTPDSRMNILEIPRGGQYQITLTDGTRVWLNSATTLKYPSVFKGKERHVELTGEAYFEVSKNSTMPFKVTTQGQTVIDIGTIFNINAYNEEPAIKTTLIEGSVRVTEGDENKILKPGQQTIIANDHKITLVNHADLEEATAWKDNTFRFDNEDLESIMRKVSRWYDVDIEYKSQAVKGLRFGGVVTRFTNASKVLMMLELTNEVHFKIVEGDDSGKRKKIIVMK